MESKLPLIMLEEEHYEQYKNLIDNCYYEMRKSLNIQPYDKHSCSLTNFSKLKKHTFLYLINDEIICAITCPKNNIENVVVSSKYQHQGYGRKIMKFALSYMQKRGDSPIQLAVTKWNKNAIALYKSLGFEIIKETTAEGFNILNTEGNWNFEFTETGDLNIR